MSFLFSLLAVLLSILLAAGAAPLAWAATPPIGILTQAYQARVNEALAFPGLSIFEGERISTDAQGRIGVRVGNSVLSLSGNTVATAYWIYGGVHVDLATGSVYFSAAKSEVVEIHVAEAELRSADNQLTQAVVKLLTPKVLQIEVRKGGLNFSYRAEFRFLPAGETYRIYLDAPEEPEIMGGLSSQKAGMGGKVAYFIVGTGSAGLAAWGVGQATASGAGIESPAKP